MIWTGGLKTVVKQESIHVTVADGPPHHTPLNVEFCLIVYVDPWRVTSLDCKDISAPEKAQNMVFTNNPPAVGVNY